MVPEGGKSDAAVFVLSMSLSGGSISWSVTGQRDPHAPFGEGRVTNRGGIKVYLNI